MAANCIGMRLRSSRCIHERLADILQVISWGNCKRVQISYNSRVRGSSLNFLLKGLIDNKYIISADVGIHQGFKITDKGREFLETINGAINQMNVIVGKVINYYEKPNS